jgi:hypothetical protein
MYSTFVSSVQLAQHRLGELNDTRAANVLNEVFLFFESVFNDLGLIRPGSDPYISFVIGKSRANLQPGGTLVSACAAHGECIRELRGHKDALVAAHVAGMCDAAAVLMKGG